MLHFFRRIGAFFRSLWAELTQKKESQNLSEGENEILRKLKQNIGSSSIDSFMSKLTNVVTFSSFASQSSYEKALAEAAELIASQEILRIAMRHNQTTLAVMFENVITTLINENLNKGLIFLRAALLSVIPELANSTAVKMKEIEEQQSTPVKLIAKGFELGKEVTQKAVKFLNPTLCEQARAHLERARDNLEVGRSDVVGTQAATTPHNTTTLRGMRR